MHEIWLVDIYQQIAWSFRYLQVDYHYYVRDGLVVKTIYTFDVIARRNAKKMLKWKIIKNLINNSTCYKCLQGNMIIWSSWYLTNQLNTFNKIPTQAKRTDLRWMRIGGIKPRMNDNKSWHICVKKQLKRRNLTIFHTSKKNWPEMDEDWRYKTSNEW